MLFLQRLLRKHRASYLLILLVYGCGSPLHIPPVSVTPTQSYRLHKDIDGLVLAVDPFVEEDRLNQYFGTNLVQKKLLPVLFVMENRRGQDGFMVESSQITVVLRDKASKPGIDQATVAVPTTDKNLLAVIAPLSIAGALIIPVAGLAGIALLPFLLAAESQRDTALKINDNLTKKALVDRTLYPGETTSGFVYFPLSQPDQLVEIAGFVVKLKKLKNDQVVEVVLPSR